MNTSIIRFEFETQQVRTLNINNEPWFVAKDIMGILGLSNTTETIRSLDEDEFSTTELIDSIGRRQQSFIVSESGLYSLVLRSRKPQAAAFRRWVTGEVLPSIRKTGSYSTVPALSEDEIVAQALQITSRRVEALEGRVAELEPKARFADAVNTSHTSILVGELAKIMRGNGVDVGQNRFFAWLRRDGFLIKRAGTDYNMPTQKSMELGLFEIKETVIARADGHTTISKTPKITGKGQTYLYDYYATAA